MGTPHATLFIDITDEFIKFPEPTPLALPAHLLITEVSAKPAPNYPPSTHSPRPFEHESIPWALLGTLVFLLGLFYTYYLTVFRFTRYPTWYYAPMISFCGCHYPEQIPWRWTWILAGVFQTTAQLTLPSTHLYKHFLSLSPWSLRLGARLFIAFHAMSSVCVGLFPLYPRQCRESVAYIEVATPWSEMRLDVSALMHYASAVGAGIGGLVGIPMAIAAWHCAFVSYTQRKERVLSESTLRALWSVFVFKVLCCAVMYIACVCIVCVGPLWVWRRGFVSKAMMNFLSASEWMLGLPMGLFDACISVENYIVVEALNQGGGGVENNKNKNV